MSPALALRPIFEKGPAHPFDMLRISWIRGAFFLISVAWLHSGSLFRGFRAFSLLYVIKLRVLSALWALRTRSRHSDSRSASRPYSLDLVSGLQSLLPTVCDKTTRALRAMGAPNTLPPFGFPLRFTSLHPHVGTFAKWPHIRTCLHVRLCGRFAHCFITSFQGRLRAWEAWAP